MEEPSILGAAIGFEFECSFAAAEANKAAHELLDERVNQRDIDERRRSQYHECPPYQEIQIVGQAFDLQKTEVIDLDWHPVLAEQPVKLALLQPIIKTKRAITGRTKFLRRTVSAEHEVEQTGDPVLAAIFGDVALPLATFSRRKDGNCSYVQIGSEVKDDNFHVMASDDRTGRHVVIEAVRSILNPRQTERLIEPDHINSETEEQHKIALEKLLNIEFRQNIEQLTAAFEAQLVRKCAERLDTKSWRRLTVFDDQGQRLEQRFATRVIVDNTKLVDGRVAHLMIGAPIEGTNQDMLQLLAVTRSKLAISIATLNASTGKIIFENANIAPNSQLRKQVVYQFLSILRGEPLVTHGNHRVTFTAENSEALQGKSGQKESAKARARMAAARKAIGATVQQARYQLANSEEDREIACYFHNSNRNQGLFVEGELPDLRSQGWTGTVVGPINRFLKNPQIVANPYPDSAVMRVAVERLNRENTVRQNIFNQFDIQARFSDILGETSINDETLVDELYNLRCDSETHRGVIKAVRMNNTAASALIELKVLLEGTLYAVTVSGKPEAMDDEPLKVLPALCFEFDSARPIQAQLNGKSDSIQELRRAFTSLAPVKAEVTKAG